MIASARLKYNQIKTVVVGSTTEVARLVVEGLKKNNIVVGKKKTWLQKPKGPRTQGPKARPTLEAKATTWS